MSAHLALVSNSDPDPIRAADLELARAHTAYGLRRNLKEWTLYQRERLVLRLAEWLYANTDRSLLTATTEDVDDFLDSKGHSPDTRRSYLSALSSFFKWLHRYHEAPGDEPTAEAIRPKTSRRLPRPLPEEHYARCIETAPPVIMRAAVLLMGDGGLRACEVGSVRASWYDADERRLFVIGKGDRERYVPLTGRCAEAVEAARMDRRLDSEPLLVHPMHGGEWTAKSIAKALGLFFDGLGLDRYTGHQLRHRAGTKLYQATGDLRLVQEFLGHADVSTTQIYTAVSSSALASAVSALEG